jgi:hypothetical protein
VRGAGYDLAPRTIYGRASCHQRARVHLRAAGRGGRGAATAPGPHEIRLPQASGTAGVIATFPVAGDYVMRAQVDNWDSPDSSAGDQCSWTNAYVRVRVTP